MDVRNNAGQDGRFERTCVDELFCSKLHWNEKYRVILKPVNKADTYLNSRESINLTSAGFCGPVFASNLVLFADKNYVERKFTVTKKTARENIKTNCNCQAITKTSLRYSKGVKEEVRCSMKLRIETHAHFDNCCDGVSVNF